MLWLPSAPPGQSLVVRRAGPRDARAMATVHLETWRATYRGQIGDDYLDGLNEAAFERQWRHIFAARGWSFVALFGDRVVGIASGGRSRRPGAAEGEIYVLYLLPAYQGIGLGRALFDACHYELARRGRSDCVVWVLASNTNARRFYERLGGKLSAEGDLTLGGQRLHEVAYYWPA